jgi:hypothetical protein
LTVKLTKEIEILPFVMYLVTGVAICENSSVVKETWQHLYRRISNEEIKPG